MTDTARKPTTSDSGAPVESDEHSLTVGRAGRSCSRTRT